MDHRYIEEVEVIDRYLMGRLAAEESAEFESHFVDCEECIDRLNTTREFMAGLKLIASEQAGRRDTQVRRYWWLQFTRSRKTLALVASVIFLALVAGAILVSRELRRTRIDAAQANESSAEWRRRYEEQQAANSSMSNAERDTKGEKGSQSARRPGNDSNKSDTENIAEPGDPKKPRINVAIFVLTSTRGTNQASGGENLLRLRRGDNFVISVPLEGETNYVDYRMSLTRSRGGRAWESGGLRADSHNLLTVEFNSSLFANGDYELTVEGQTREETRKTIGKYALRIIKD